MIPDKELLTANDAAQALGVKPRTVRRWIDEERLPAIRTPGGMIRIPREAVVGMVEKKG